MAVIETYHSALELGTEAIKQAGVHPYKAERYKSAFAAAEHEARQRLFEVWSEGLGG